MCNRVQLTVNLLDVNVISLRVADGDLLLDPALSEDQTLLHRPHRNTTTDYFMDTIVCVCVFDS